MVVDSKAFRIELAAVRDRIRTLENALDNARRGDARRFLFRFSSSLLALGALADLDEDALHEFIASALAEVGQHYQLDIVTLWWFDDDQKGVHRTHAWAKDKAGKRTHYKVGELPWLLGKLLEKKTVRFKRVDELPEEASKERALIKSAGIASDLLLPMTLGRSLVGCVSFSTCEERDWNEGLVVELRLAGEMIACAYHRVWYELQLREQQRKTDEALAKIQELQEQLTAENLDLKEEITRAQGFDEIIGEDATFLSCLQAVEKVAPTDSTVLILGESGTGKELIARSVHRRSARKDKPFLALNCAALPPNLIESELFGHEKGAFTGAVAQRQGAFEKAGGGTLFLDEIGDLPLELQAKLLRVLQEGEIQRIGSTKTISVDVRVVAATHRDLEREVEADRFRQDLFYRLNVFPITLPSLRERPGDIPLLAQYFANKHAERLGRDGLEGISAGMIRQLQAYGWPGNVRELENVIVRALIAGAEPLLKLAAPLLPSSRGGSLASQRLEDVERRHIQAVLEQTSWTIEGDQGAAACLGLAPSTLRSRMRKLGIKRPD